MTRVAGWPSLFLALSAALAPTAGCSDPVTNSGRPSDLRGSDSEDPVDALKHAITVLGTESFDSQEALHQAADRLTQWLGSQRNAGAWKPDPLVATLPESLRKSPPVEKLGDPRADDAAADCRYIQQSMWLRDISNQMRDDSADDLLLAQRLFDWTVRNIQLETDRPMKGREDVRRSTGYLPWEVLLLGRGTALHRAWLFILLARQQDLDVVMLARPAANADGALRPWIPALYHEGELYLFDPALGLPIPGTDEKGLPLAAVEARNAAAGVSGKAAPPVFQTATLKQVAADDKLLRHLDLEGRPYPVKAGDLNDVVALVEASPFALSRRMQLIEAKLSGDQRVVLSADASFIADQIKKCDHIADVRLWTLPFEVAEFKRSLSQQSQALAQMELAPLFISVPVRPKGATDKPSEGWGILREPLLKARLLHFRGQFDGENGAKQFYMLARPKEAHIDILDARSKNPLTREALETARENATYWLGLLTSEQGDYATAIEHLSKRTLEESLDTPWTSGARYNLARSLEAAGRVEEAIKLYEADDSPQQHGNLIRAGRLETRAAPGA